jgi:hypothetical protein
MRHLVLSIGFCILILGAAWAQNEGDDSAHQIPVGQVFKNFEFPRYEDGQLKYTLSAPQATGITQNRAETIDLKIELYTNGAVTTTITSPKADLYIAERKMRTKNTVRIERSDMVATAQTCDFDVYAKKYLLRTNVRVVLKNFDAGKSASFDNTSASAPTVPTAPAPRSTPNPDSLLDSPGAYSSTHSPPPPPTRTDTK